MSQAGIISFDGAIIPTVPTSFVTDNGTAVPAANILNVNGGFTTATNDNGITAIANPNGSNNLLIELTNRFVGTGTSVNAAVVNLITFPLAATAASYRFQFETTGRDTVSGDGVGYTMFASARTNGAAATIVETPYTDVDEDASLISANINLIASGNSVILQVTGVLGQTLVYKAVGSYLVV